MDINTLEALKAFYNKPKERAQKKVLSSLDTHCIKFISKSPFLILSTSSEKDGLDTSPRGGIPGFVNVLNEKEIAIPDFKGNNRLDSLQNIIETGNASLIFLIPGIDETLRVNGTARISSHPHILKSFHYDNLPPKTYILIEVQEAFLHCAKALMRSKLWEEKSKINRDELPTMGQMLKDQTGLEQAVETQEEMINRYNKDL